MVFKLICFSTMFFLVLELLLVFITILILF